ncbi:TetR/AcrR family transcriptional regulator [Egibacter rhizosphaerae]|uniref:TetR/AcrR family transcriptional regulator n=1 Tax=Egibacter rhizosphaerae TaxID=1670831 RepID=A0A411YFI7_9ACTN|nr:TetR/AcrR family transcriptional regulator [Egibacter rhizosphaerae]QBI19882.1 TetR/AcrR family transcriptional regulator [Egibacter rhizosphaerae]
MARTVDPQRHRARREHILHAAAELFAAKGFDGTSVSDICRAAGISTGNLFHYFASKREVFAALLRDGTTATEEALVAALADDDPWEALLGFVDHLVAPAAEPLVPGLVLEAMLQAKRDPELAELLAHDADDERAGVVAILDRSVEAGMLDVSLDVDHTADWVMAMVGAVYLRAATDERFDAAAQRTTLRLTVERFLGPHRRHA